MRLSHLEQTTIRDASLRHFGVLPRLFGSRTDDSKRGGDIDLYIEAQLDASQAFDKQVKMVADIWRTLGERKIDVVVNTGRQNLPIYHVAQTQGVWL